MSEPEQTSDCDKIIETLQGAIDNVVAGNNQRHADHKTSISWERRRFLLDLAGTGGLWAAAAVGLIAICVSSHDASEQRGVMQRQLLQMQADHNLTTAELRASVRWAEPQIYPVGSNGALTPGAPIEGWAFSPKWHNEGSTEARNYVSWFDIKVISLPKGHQVDASSCPKAAEPKPPPLKITIEKGGDSIMMAKTLPITTVLSMKASKAVALMYGHIEYRDIFPRTPLHYIDWCVALGPNDLRQNIWSKPILSWKTD